MPGFKRYLPAGIQKPMKRFADSLSPGDVVVRTSYKYRSGFAQIQQPFNVSAVEALDELCVDASGHVLTHDLSLPYRNPDWACKSNLDHP